MAHSSKAKSSFKALPLTTAIATALTAGVASAQIEEVVVTATKRAESLQDIGVAVSAITGDALSSGNIVAPRDLFNRVPNVQL